jgi:hypothetical protein
MEEITFIEKFDSDWSKLDIYEKGYRIIVTPKTYFSTNTYKGHEEKIIVRYRHHSEVNDYPYNEEDITKKVCGKLTGFLVVDIQDLDSINGKTIYKGVKNIGRPDMEYATNNEVEKIKFCNMYVIGKIYNIDQYLELSILNLFKKYCVQFEESDLYKNNEKLIELTKNGSVCPDLGVHLSFLDLIDGKQLSDSGRDKWLITTTKINIHHIRKRTPGELNHNHKNAFFGTAIGNTLDITLPPDNPKTLELSIKRLNNHFSKNEIIEELNRQGVLN